MAESNHLSGATSLMGFDCSKDRQGHVGMIQQDSEAQPMKDPLQQCSRAASADLERKGIAPQPGMFTDRDGRITIIPSMDAHGSCEGCKRSTKTGPSALPGIAASKAVFM